VLASADKPAETTPPNAGPSRPDAPRSDERGDAASQVTRELARFTSLLRDRDVAQLTSLLGAAGGQEEKNRDALLALVRRSPISMDEPRLESPPEPTGTRTTIEFSSTVRWRTPFGANRERRVTFAAEMDRDGGSWRLVRCRVLGDPNFS
jgi:hypothetical protein